ncbi:MAG: CHAD domain-containing protein [Anaerolineales bacterium]|nr:MAG: CHAD domain-containing protein [Anaerolineales bacterium]
MDAKALLLNALDTRWKKYRSELKLCRAEFSEEAVHDVRVAARRLLAFFDLLRSVLHHARIQTIRRALKNQLAELDDLRDAQVLLADISEYIHEVPDLEVFREYLEKKERKYLRAARTMVASHKAGNLSERVEKARIMITELPGEELAEQLLEAADEAYARVLRLYGAVDAERVATIHKLRIAFKRFRYTVEVLHPLLETFLLDNFERMHTYQTMMGDIQDMEVALDGLSELMDTLQKPDPESPRSLWELDKAKALSIHEHYASRFRNVLLAYLEDKGEVLTFWRPAPEGSFPWEK